MSASSTGAGGGVEPDAGSAPEKGASVDVDEIVGKVTEAVNAKVADMVTGAVTRNVKAALASAFDGLDIEALKKGQAAPTKTAGTAEDDDKVNPLRAEYDAQKAIVEGLRKDVDGYKARAMRAGVQEALAEFTPTKAGGELVLDKFAAIVTEDTAGKLYVESNGTTVSIEDSLTAYFRDRQELLQASAREGSGAGAGKGWSEKMPTTKAELMFETKKNKFTNADEQVPSPSRAAAFIKAHGEEAYEALA